MQSQNVRNKPGGDQQEENKKERECSHVRRLAVLESGNLCREKLRDGHGTGRNRLRFAKRQPRIQRIRHFVRIMQGFQEDYL